MRRSSNRPGLLSVVVPSGIVIAGAWLLARYLDNRDAEQGRVHGARTERARGRWNWPTASSSGQSGEAALHHPPTATGSGPVGA